MSTLRKIWFALLLVLGAGGVFALVSAQTFTGPNCAAGQCQGVISVDSARNLAIGTTTVYSDTRLFIQGGNSTTTAFAIQLKNQEGRPLFIMRNDGRVVMGPFPIGGAPSFPSAATLQVRGLIETVNSTNPDLGGGIRFPDGSTLTTAPSAVTSPTTTAGNVSSGVFGANLGNGNFAFPASLGVGTTTQANLPQELSVVGDGYFSGNLSLGIATPSGRLHVQGLVSGVTASLRGTGTENVVQQLCTNAGCNYLGVDDASTLLTLGGTSDAVGGFSPTIWVQGNNGDVGIGTSTLSSKLTVAGAIRSTTGGVVFPDGTTQTTAATSSTNYWSLSGSNLYPTSTSYRVGIGTTTPSSGYGLTIDAGANSGIFIKSTGALAVALSNSSRSWAVINGVAGTGYFSIYDGTAAQNRLTIDTSGNVGIGTTTPAYPLTVNGVIHSLTGGLRFPDGTTQTTAAAAGSVTTTAANIGSGVFGANLGNGNFAFPASLGVGTTTQANLPQTLSVNGGASFSSNVGIGTASPVGRLTVFNMNVNPGTNALAIGWDSSYYYTIGRDHYNGGHLLFDGSNNSSGGKFAFMSGNVGIGTTTPAVALHVIGTSTISGNLSIGGTSALAGTVTIGGGTGKINVGTVDPIYTIGGKRYATYLPAMTGQKEETTGTLSCVPRHGMCTMTIDLAGSAEGSDTWLFGKVTNIGEHFDDLVVLLTPSFDGKAWYKKDAGKRTVTIYGEGAGDVLEVSYRLTAPRFDGAEWLNRSKDAEEGFNLDKLLK